MINAPALKNALPPLFRKYWYINLHESQFASLYEHSSLKRSELLKERIYSSRAKVFPLRYLNTQ